MVDFLDLFFFFTFLNDIAHAYVTVPVGVVILECMLGHILKGTR